jgi:hypothetical protein
MKLYPALELCQLLEAFEAFIALILEKCQVMQPHLAFADFVHLTCTAIANIQEAFFQIP